MIRAQVLICGGTGCTSSGSATLIKEFEEQIKAFDLEEEVKIVRTGCFGLCALGPVVIVYPDGTFYSRVEKDDVKEIVSEHLLKGRQVDRLVYKDVGEDYVEEDHKIVSLNDTNFYKKQHRVALRNCGVINPESIDEYIAVDGYAALGKALTEMTPEAAADSRRVSSGASRRLTKPIRSMSSVTPTRATRAHSWTVRFSKATRTVSSRLWLSAATPRAQQRAMSMSERSTP